MKTLRDVVMLLVLTAGLMPIAAAVASPSRGADKPDPAVKAREDAWWEVIGGVCSRAENINNTNSPKMLHVLSTLQTDFLDARQTEQSIKFRSERLKKGDLGPITDQAAKRLAKCKAEFDKFVAKGLELNADRKPGAAVKGEERKVTVAALDSELAQIKPDGDFPVSIKFPQNVELGYLEYGDDDWNLVRNDFGAITGRERYVNADYRLPGWPQCVLLHTTLFQAYDGKKYGKSQATVLSDIMAEPCRAK